MLLKLTSDEIKWRYKTLTDKIESNSTYTIKAYEFNDSFGFKDYVVWDLIHVSILYLCKIGHINATLYSEGEIPPAMFTCTKEEFRKHALDYKINSYDKIDRDIPIPDIFADENEQYDHITVGFNFPQNELGELCERMINELRRRCKNDVDVINIVTFESIYLYANPSLYFSCFWIIASISLIESHYTAGSNYPLEILDLLPKLLGNNLGNIYDPFGRTCLNSDIANDKYFAQVNDIEHLYMGILSSAIYDKDWEHIELGDCKSNWDTHGCDTIIATPYINDTYIESDGNSSHISKFVLKNLLQSLVEGNCVKAITLLPANVLYDKSYANIRQEFVSNGLLDTVVLLPKNLFDSTGVAATLIIFNKNRSTDNVRMIDLSNIVTSKEGYAWDEKEELDSSKAIEVIETNNSGFVKFENFENIISHEYSWYVTSYFSLNIDVPNGYIKVKLSDLMKKIPMYEIGPDLNNAIIGDNDLKSDPFESNIVHAKKDLRDVPGDSDDHIFIWNDCFIASFFNEVKSVWFDSDTNYFSNNGVCIFDSCANPYYVNKDVVDIDYLRYVLSLVQKDLEKQNRFPIVNEAAFYPAEDLFMNAEVVIPISIEEQRRIYVEEKGKYLVKKAHQEGLEEAKRQVKEEYVEELRMRRHDMKPFLSQIDSLAKLIPFYLNKIKGNEDTVMTIQNKVDALSESVQELRKRLNRLTDEEIFGEPELVNIVTSLKQYEGNYSNYNIKVNIDGLAIEELHQNPLVHINPVDLSTLCNTVIDNAVTHAFVDRSKQYTILINLRVSEDKRCFIIDFTNNGAPMPEGMDKRRYGINGEKGAKSSGTGFGGYRVKSITRHYYGDYDVITRQKDGTDTYNQKYKDWNIESINDDALKSIMKEQLAIRKKYEIPYPSNDYCTTIRIFLIIAKPNEKI